MFRSKSDPCIGLTDAANLAHVVGPTSLRWHELDTARKHGTNAPRLENNPRKKTRLSCVIFTASPRTSAHMMKAAFDEDLFAVGGRVAKCVSFYNRKVPVADHLGGCIQPASGTDYCSSLHFK